MSYKHIKKVGEKYYLYEIKGTWDSEKKNSIQERKYIGPCDENGNIQTTRKRSIPIASKTFGPYWLLDRIADEMGLWDQLKDCFDDELAESMKVLSMLRMVRPAPLRQTEDLFEESFLSSMVSDSDFGSRSLSRLLERINESSRNKFFSERYDGKNALVFDLTAFASESEKMERNEFGDEYKKIRVPQVSMGMIHSAETGIPFCYRLYPGSIADVKTLENITEFVSSLGCENAHFVMDRGFYSEKNLEMMVSRNLGFTIPVPAGRKIFKNTISESVRNISSANTDYFNGSVIRHWDTEVKVGDLELNAYVFLDEKRRGDEIESLYLRLQTYETQINGRKWTKGIHKLLRLQYGTEVLRFLELKDDNGIIRTERKRNALTACENACGRMVILSSSRESWDKVLMRYRGRNDIESDFRILKSHLSGGVKCLQNDVSADGMIFIQFLALILHCELFRRLRESAIYKKYWIPDIMNELGKLKVTLIGKKWILNEVSKKQRTILEALRVAVPTTESMNALVTKN